MKYTLRCCCQKHFQVVINHNSWSFFSFFFFLFLFILSSFMNYSFSIITTFILNELLWLFMCFIFIFFISLFISAITNLCIYCLKLRTNSRHKQEELFNGGRSEKKKLSNTDFKSLKVETTRWFILLLLDPLWDSLWCIKRTNLYTLQ